MKTQNAVLLVSFLFVTACGGGGSGQTALSPIGPYDYDGIGGTVVGYNLPACEDAIASKEARINALKLANEESDLVDREMDIYNDDDGNHSHREKLSALKERREAVRDLIKCLKRSEEI